MTDMTFEESPHGSLIAALIADHQTMQGALLPLLHAIQDKIGFIPPESVGAIAQGLNLSRAEVHGVITYYHFFRTQPAGRHVVQICRAEACQACGANALYALAEKVIGCDTHPNADPKQKSHPMSANGAVSLQPVYCLGLCASSPAIQIDAQLHARVSAKQLEQLLAPLL